MLKEKMIRIQSLLTIGLLSINMGFIFSQQPVVPETIPEPGDITAPIVLTTSERDQIEKIICNNTSQLPWYFTKLLFIFIFCIVISRFVLNET